MHYSDQTSEFKRNNKNGHSTYSMMTFTVIKLIRFKPPNSHWKYHSSSEVTQDVGSVNCINVTSMHNGRTVLINFSDALFVAAEKEIKKAMIAFK